MGQWQQPWHTSRARGRRASLDQRRAAKPPGSDSCVTPECALRSRASWVALLLPSVHDARSRAIPAQVWHTMLTAPRRKPGRTVQGRILPHGHAGAADALWRLQLHETRMETTGNEIGMKPPAESSGLRSGPLTPDTDRSGVSTQGAPVRSASLTCVTSQCSPKGASRTTGAAARGPHEAGRRKTCATTSQGVPCTTGEENRGGRTTTGCGIRCTTQQATALRHDYQGASG